MSKVEHDIDVIKKLLNSIEFAVHMMDDEDAEDYSDELKYLKQKLVELVGKCNIDILD